MRPDDPVAWAFGRQRFGMKPGLERVHALLAAIGAPQERFATVLVAGTNGKGSTARALAAALQAAGRRTALFTSPHLSRVVERFRVDGAEVAPERLAATLAAMRAEAERLDATFFEIVTAAACRLFADAGAEVAVMEVGLGGRYDATNALEPSLSLITGVALDHTAVLGDRVELIAADKAGILRRGVPALTGAVGAALAVIEAEAQALQAPLWRLGHELEVEVESLGWDGLRLQLRSPIAELRATSPLLGAHQGRNLALAAAAALRLGAPPAEVARGLALARWPGRLERLPYRGRWLLLDGAHNPEAAAALAAALAALGVDGVTALLGLSGDKDLAGVAAALAPRLRTVVATRARLSPRARPAAEVAAAFGADAEAIDDPGAALERALALTPPGGTLLVAGSLYLLGELRPLVVGEEGESYERWQ